MFVFIYVSVSVAVAVASCCFPSLSLLLPIAFPVTFYFFVLRLQPGLNMGAAKGALNIAVGAISRR